MSRLLGICIVSMLTLFVCTHLANADMIDFESDTDGLKPNGWASADSALVTFSDSMGEDLRLQDWWHQSHGKGLATYWDDESYLIMDFGVLPATDLQLEFGNDDPVATNPGDLAVLTAFLGGTQVGQTTVVMNRDDIMNQTIGISGVVFDRATFFYDVTRIGWTGMIEIVDNIEFNVVPIPGAVLLGILGLSVAGIKLRKHA